MADFLAKLAGRTLGTEPSPRPVIAPMFAAGPMMAGEYLPEAVLQEPPAGNGLSSLMPPTARLEQVGRTTRPEPSIEPAAGHERSAHVKPSIREDAAQRVTETGMHRSEEDASSSYKVQQMTASQQPGERSITPRIQSDFAPLKEPTNSIRPQAAILQQEQPGAPPVNFRREAHQVSAPASIIKVSIGRIEVRAVTPPAQTAMQKASSTRPQPSLDEYLQARNRGKR